VSPFVGGGGVLFFLFGGGWGFLGFFGFVMSSPINWLTPLMLSHSRPEYR